MNLNEKPIREKYKEFYGSNLEQMELLIKDNRIPLSMKDIIERRLNSNQKNWKDNYFDTCDAIVYGKDGKFKIIKDCDILKNMNSKTQLEEGGIKITEKEYSKIKSPEFSDKYKEQVWKYLLEELYEEYVKLLGYCPKIYISSNEFLIRAWFVGWLVDGYGSYTVGRVGLDVDDGRLVGIASEMQEKNEIPL